MYDHRASAPPSVCAAERVRHRACAPPSVCATERLRHRACAGQTLCTLRPQLTPIERAQTMSNDSHDKAIETEKDVGRDSKRPRPLDDETDTESEEDEEHECIETFRKIDSISYAENKCVYNVLLYVSGKLDDQKSVSSCNPRQVELMRNCLSSSYYFEGEYVVVYYYDIHGLRAIFRGAEHFDTFHRDLMPNDYRGY